MARHQKSPNGATTPEETPKPEGQQGDLQRVAEAALAIASTEPVRPPVNNVTEQPLIPAEPDLASAPREGVDAYLAIMDAAEAEAETLRQTGVNAINVADAFKAAMQRTIEDICAPTVIAAMEYQQLANQTADKVLLEARKQADLAIAFTKRLRGMSNAVRQHANGGPDEQGS